MIQVADKSLPIGHQTEDGELIWIHKDKVLDSKYELIDDLKYYFKQLIDSDDQLFMNAQMDKKEEVTDFKVSVLKR